jgi:hypothetical protein
MALEQLFCVSFCDDFFRFLSFCDRFFNHNQPLLINKTNHFRMNTVDISYFICSTIRRSCVKKVNKTNNFRMNTVRISDFFCSTINSSVCKKKERDIRALRSVTHTGHFFSIRLCDFPWFARRDYRTNERNNFPSTPLLFSNLARPQTWKGRPATTVVKGFIIGDYFFFFS